MIFELFSCEKVFLKYLFIYFISGNGKEYCGVVINLKLVPSKFKCHPNYFCNLSHPEKHLSSEKIYLETSLGFRPIFLLKVALKYSLIFERDSYSFKNTFYI